MTFLIDKQSKQSRHEKNGVLTHNSGYYGLKFPLDVHAYTQDFFMSAMFMYEESQECRLLTTK